MAIANSTQILVDSNKRTVIKRIGVIDSDESLTVIIDPRALSGALNANNLPYYSGNTVASGFANSAFTISRVIACVDAEVGHLQLQWQGTSASQTIYAFGDGINKHRRGDFGGIRPTLKVELDNYMTARAEVVA